MYNEELVEEGIVIESKDGIAEVALIPNDNCDECSARLFCKPKSENTKIIQANDPFGVRQGDQVQISVEGNLVLKLSALLYGLPLAVFVSMIMIGLNLFDHSDIKELLAFSLSLLTTAAYYFLLNLLSRWANKKFYLPKIVLVRRRRFASA